MLDSTDWGRMAADLVSIREDNEESIIIRRGSSTLAAQDVRIARTGGQGQTRDSEGAQESRGRVLVLGGTEFDVAPGDRFNDGAGVLYQVVLVRSNREAAVVAEAEVVE